MKLTIPLALVAARASGASAKLGGNAHRDLVAAGSITCFACSDGSVECAVYNTTSTKIASGVCECPPGCASGGAFVCKFGVGDGLVALDGLYGVALDDGIATCDVTVVDSSMRADCRRNCVDCPNCGLTICDACATRERTCTKYDDEVDGVVEGEWTCGCPTECDDTFDCSATDPIPSPGGAFRLLDENGSGLAKCVASSDDTAASCTGYCPPTDSPTANPTKHPTGAPTSNPTGAPTSNPTSNPTESPTKNPTKEPEVCVITCTKDSDGDCCNDDKTCTQNGGGKWQCK